MTVDGLIPPNEALPALAVAQLQDDALAFHYLWLIALRWWRFLHLDSLMDTVAVLATLKPIIQRKQIG